VSLGLDISTEDRQVVISSIGWEYTDIIWKGTPEQARSLASQLKAAARRAKTTGSAPDGPHWPWGGPCVGDDDKAE
jgi:hypothetical protein